MLAAGLEIHDATRSMLWPGEAAVAVSVVHLAKGNARRGIRERRLDGKLCEAHLMFSFQQTGRVFSHKLAVIPLDHFTAFAILQARVHASWAWLLSSTMKQDLNYSPSDCFDTFAFPQPDPRAVIPALESIGQRVYEARASYMRKQQVGLTETYNRLKDPDCTEEAIVALRQLHLELDRAVLDAYGWSEVPVPSYTTPRTPEETRALEAFEDEVIDRLFLLNAERAEAERRLGATGKKAKGGGRGRKRVARRDTGTRQLDFSGGE